MNEHQSKVIERLAEAGWISRTWESESKLMIQWTEYGVEQLYRLGEILHDAGFDLMKQRKLSFFA